MGLEVKPHNTLRGFCDAGFLGGGFHDIWSSPKRPPIIDPLLTSKSQPALTEIPSLNFP